MQRLAVHDLLQQTIGLDAATLQGTIARAVHDRMMSCGFSDEATYAELACTSALELQALIEAVVVPETWFFRNTEAFAEMARCIVAKTLGSSRSAVSLLSVPCSSGEEPFSMAMALLDAGVPANRFHIDAVDISGRALARARSGRFGSNSFRGQDLAFRQRYFEAKESVFTIRDAVRERVRFVQGNLFSNEFMPGAARYDVIFCRNLLVYCDGVAQDRALAILRRLLAPGGVLFVAPAEAGLLVRHDFIWSRAPRAFAFCAASASPSSSETRAASVCIARAPAPSKQALGKRSRPAEHAVAQTAPHREAAVDAPDLDAAYHFADSGNFTEAARVCEQHMYAHDPTPRALVLQGLINEAAGDSERAIVSFRKALYLDARCVEAIAHLALLLDRCAEHASARLLRERLQRLTSSAQAAR